MQLRNQTVLITGGSSGIGLELARQLLSSGNKVIICGRSEARLAEAKKTLPTLDYFRCDLAQLEDCRLLSSWVISNHPSCNVLINNAAIVHRGDFHEDDAAVEKAILEIDINLVAPIALTKMLLPHLELQKRARVINITTGLVYAPRAIYPIYNATKAALHSFSQVLRYQLKNTPINVIEVMMPVVDTPWHEGHVPKIAISPERAVKEMIRRVEAGQYQIRVGKVRLLYVVSRILPGLAFRMINRVS
ncbi:SDR family NAD(P)-dependent oxidoreductase [Chryseolinea sp. T2]|uniref:SDR family oxidoreductase n=1 Tax=Chryseolinea sp. T2 TaxID=3129255 RepID=UPI003076CAFE